MQANIDSKSFSSMLGLAQNVGNELSHESVKKEMLQHDIIRYIFERATDLEDQQKYKAAIAELQKVQKVIKRSSGNKVTKIFSCLDNKLGTLYYKLKDFDSALYHHQRNLENSIPGSKVI